MGITGVDHVGVHVGDLEGGLAFYRDLLGLDLVARPPGLRGTWLETGRGQVHLLTGESQAHVALAVADLESALERLAAAGVPLRRLPHLAGAGLQAFATDPYGNAVELIQR